MPQHCRRRSRGCADHAAHLLQVEVSAQQLCILQQLPQLAGLQGPAERLAASIQQRAGASTAAANMREQTL